MHRQSEKVDVNVSSKINKQKSFLLAYRNFKRFLTCQALFFGGNNSGAYKEMSSIFADQ